MNTYHTEDTWYNLEVRALLARVEERVGAVCNPGSFNKLLDRVYQILNDKEPQIIFSLAHTLLNAIFRSFEDDDFDYSDVLTMINYDLYTGRYIHEPASQFY